MGSASSRAPACRLPEDPAVPFCLATLPPGRRRPVTLTSIRSVLCNTVTCLEYSNHYNGLSVSSVLLGNAVATSCRTGLACSALASIHSASVMGLSEIM